MAKRFQMPFAQWTNTNSAIEAGAKLEFFESGTSTPLDTYTDETQATPNANPVIADAAGQFPAIFLQARDYKVTLKDSLDVLLWTADPVIGGLEGTGAVVPRGYIDGLILSTAADTDHDIQVAAGIARDSIDGSTIEVTSAIIKQIDVDWAEGTNSGGFPSALTLATSTWYHFFVIVNTATNTVDAGFDTSLTAVNLLSDATGYTVYRRIGSVKTDSGPDIIQFGQFGDEFFRKVPFQDFSDINPGTSLQTITLDGPPTGVEVWAKVTFEVVAGGVNPSFLVSSVGMPDTAPSGTINHLDFASLTSNHVTLDVRTNTSAQIRYRLSGSDGSTIVSGVFHSFVDLRGKDS